jgi:hypothetical protein
MMKRIRFTPATVLAAAALFVALAGTATATTSALITGAQIKDGTIGVRDLSKKARQALRGPRGPRGLTGLEGSPGVPGPVGPVGPAGGFNQSNIQYVTGLPRMFAPGETAYVHAECPSGSKILGGGYWAAGMLVLNNSPSQDLRSWSVLIENDYTINVQAVAWAACAAQ